MLRRFVWFGMVLISIVVCGPTAFVVTRAVATRSFPGMLGFDSYAYLAGAQAVLAGRSPLEAHFEIGSSYYYPPLLALLLAPVALLDLPLGIAVLMCLFAMATVTLIIPLAQMTGWPIAILGVLGFEPVWSSLAVGQVNALVALVLAFAALSIVEAKDERAGLWLMVGAALKVTPAPAVIVLLMQRRYRLALVAAISGGVLMVLTVPWMGIEAWTGGFTRAAARQVDPPGMVSIGFMVSRSTLILEALQMPLLFLLTVAALGLTLLRSRALPALALMWRMNIQMRWLAGTTWLLIGFGGGLWMPLTLAVCWLACLYRVPEEISHLGNSMSYHPQMFASLYLVKRDVCAAIQRLTTA